MIDTRSTFVQAREIVADLRGLTSRPATIVVDTHGHFDHAFGNRVFRPATIWGHERCVTFMARTGEARRPRIAEQNPRSPRISRRSSSIRPTGPSRRPRSWMSATGGSSFATSDGAIPTTTSSSRSPMPASCSPATSSRTARSPGSATAIRSTGRRPRSESPNSPLGVVVPGHGDHAGRAFAEEQAVASLGVADLARRIHLGGSHARRRRRATPFPAFPPEDVRRPLRACPGATARRARLSRPLPTPRSGRSSGRGPPRRRSRRARPRACRA